MVHVILQDLNLKYKVGLFGPTTYKVAHRDEYKRLAVWGEAWSPAFVQWRLVSCLDARADELKTVMKPAAWPHSLCRVLLHASLQSRNSAALAFKPPHALTAVCIGFSLIRASLVLMSMD